MKQQQISNQVILCKNCKFFKDGWDCKSPHLGADLVRGKINKTLAYSERNNEEGCGIEGKFFEQRNPNFWEKLCQGLK